MSVWICRVVRELDTVRVAEQVARSLWDWQLSAGEGPLEVEKHIRFRDALVHRHGLGHSQVSSSHRHCNSHALKFKQVWNML